MSLVLNGVEYVEPTQTTFEHDIWLMGRVKAAGLNTFQIAPGETADAFAERVLLQVSESGAIIPLLAGLLVPAGRDWSPEVAAETQHAFGRATNPADKDALRAEVAGLLASFFKSGIASATISRSSSRKSLAEKRDPK